MRSRAIIILDMSYTLKMFNERHLDQALESRKLRGYFKRVISVHPLAGLFESGHGQYGNPIITHLDDSHLFVEGKIGICQSLSILPAINLLFAQIKLLHFLFSIAREHEVDVVRIGDPYFLGILGFILARGLRVPLVVRVGFRYDEIVRATGKPVMPSLFKFRWIEKIIERFVFSHCDLIAGANEDNMRYALENGGRPNLATVFRYGNLIHAGHWQSPSERADANHILEPLGLLNKKFAITVARLEPMKYVEDAVLCIAELARLGNDLKLLLVGDGILKAHLQSLASQLGVSNSIIYAGYQTQEWLATVLPRATVILSPHMGRALTEAALAGVPIVAYDYDWQREVVVNDETGFLVPHHDLTGLCTKVEYIITHPDDAKRMGSSARDKVLRMMNLDNLYIHEQSAYTKLFERFSAHSKINIT